MPLLVRERPPTVLGISSIGFDVDAGGGVDGLAIDLSPKSTGATDALDQRSLTRPPAA
jgi:hypothetical protein